MAGGTVQRRTLLQRVATAVGAHRLARVMRFYPPYIGAGVRVVKADPGLREIVVEMPLRAWNRNYVGTHFGGSLYAMCDPFFMLMVMERLGTGYVVWDKSAAIEFLRPGHGTVRARFEVPEGRLDDIREEVRREGRAWPVFEVDVTDAAGHVVARVTKTLSVRPRGKW